jgi:copper chaperone CopZ
MSRNLLALAGLVLCAAVLGTIAVRAKERTYTVPVHEEPRVIPTALTGAVPDGFTKRAFDVDGICCQGCSAKLHGALLAVDGVREAAVDPVLHRAEALVRTDVEPATLERALTFDKYVAHAR